MPVEWRSVPWATLRTAIRAGLSKGAGVILERSNQLVPHREGHLQRSGRVRVTVGTDRATATIAYTAPLRGRAA